MKQLAYPSGRATAEITGSNHAGGMSLVGVVCCRVETSASSRSLVQSTPTDCGVSECDREASWRRSGLAIAVEP